jgi:hypothetical protein
MRGSGLHRPDGDTENGLRIFTASRSRDALAVETAIEREQLPGRHPSVSICSTSYVRPLARQVGVFGPRPVSNMGIATLIQADLRKNQPGKE